MKSSSQLDTAKTIQRKIKVDHQREVLKMLSSIYPSSFRIKARSEQRKGLQSEEEFATLRRLIFQVAREEPGTDSYEAHFENLKSYVKHLFENRKKISLATDKVAYKSII